MIPFGVALALSLSLGSAETGRARAVRAPVHLLWIGAHPDDEALVAPIFGPPCVERGNDCALIVLTDGSGERADELKRSAAALHSRVTQWELPDVFDISQWGDHGALVTKLATAIALEAPTVIYTFDPRHGSSCHPAHREAGQLTLDAVATFGSNAPAVMLVETLIVRDSASQIVGFAPATPSATAIDATATWHYLVDDAAINKSQFTSEQIALLRAVTLDQRRIWLLPAGVPADPIASCP
jgi:LmbE family N-acetylglucosaminyl deacetylase